MQIPSIEGVDRHSISFRCRRRLNHRSFSTHRGRRPMSISSGFGRRSNRHFFASGRWRRSTLISSCNGRDPQGEKIHIIVGNGGQFPAGQLVWRWHLLSFGKECKDQELFLSILEGSSKLAGGFSIADVFPSIEGLLHWFGGIKSQLEKMHQEADQIVENIINDHKMGKTTTSELGKNEKNHEDLVDVLLKIQEDSDGEFRLTTDNMKAVIWICSLELLSTKRVQSFQSIREEEVSNLINWISSKAGSPIHLTDRLHSLTYGVTSRAAFGKRYKEQKSFVSIVIETTKLASGFSVADLFPSIEGLLQWISGIRPQLEKMHQESDIILENIISEHKKARATLDLGDKHEQNNEDLVDVLLKVQELEDSEFHLTTNNIKAVIWANINQVQTIYDIRSMLNHLGNSSGIHNSRALNCFADRLAKKASNMEGDILEWSL
ncbi:hypothetical protein LWI29_036777 [Acer saccharum]|uniref:Uncharacterized protein n=1 Tax=Acer saccharum TaxID=4024 RepID=A0AA39T147_ACESA|nr:hypothetical protein LWI29_036777 [Acer saccharum]